MKTHIILSLMLFITLNPLFAEESLFINDQNLEQNKTKNKINNEQNINKNNENNASFTKQTNLKQEKQKEHRIKENNLDYLFKNSKFPVNDYIYDTQIKEGKNENAYIQKILNQANNQEQTQTNSSYDPNNLYEPTNPLNPNNPNSPLNPNSPNYDPQLAQQILKDNPTLKEQILKKNPQLAQQILKYNENNQSKIDEIQQKINKIKTQNQALQSSIAYDENAKIKRLLRDSILASRNSEIKDFSNNNRFGDDSLSNQKSIDISTNEHRLYRMIRAGKLIPATLTTAISSDLSGVVTAQVEQDIYATMGQAVLIPRGSKVIGFYTNDNKIGQNRLEIKWREILTPQGVDILLTDAMVTDNMGMSGALGSVNNKYLERYGIAYGLSTITNALLLTISSKVDKGNNTYAQDIYSNAKSDVGTIVNDIIQQQSQIKPTIEIKAGSRIYIVPKNHMWFSKPKNGEVLMKYFIEE